MAPAGRRVGLERQIRVLHRTLDAPVEGHSEEIGQAEVLPAPSELVIKRRGEGGEQVAAALDVAANRVALRIRQRCGVGEDQQPVSIEVLRSQERFVRELKGYARFNERLIHPEHMVPGAIAVGDARVIGLCLLGEEYRDPRQRHFVAEVAFVVEVPLIDPLDDRQPAAVVKHARELGHPRPHAVSRTFGHPQANFRLALDRILPAIRFFEPDAEDAADGLSAHHGAVFFRALAVRPWRCQPASRLVVGELNRRQLAGRLEIGRTVRNEARLGIGRAHRGIPFLPQLGQTRLAPLDVLAAKRVAVRHWYGAVLRPSRPCSSARSERNGSRHPAAPSDSRRCRRLCTSRQSRDGPRP